MCVDDVRQNIGAGKVHSGIGAQTGLIGVARYEIFGCLCSCRLWCDARAMTGAYASMISSAIGGEAERLWCTANVNRHAVHCYTIVPLRGRLFHSLARRTFQESFIHRVQPWTERQSTGPPKADPGYHPWFRSHGHVVMEGV